MELRGTYAAWRITEWHTFWRGASAFLLSEVVAASYQVPVEFATTAMQDTVSRLFILGAVLGTWYAVVYVALVLMGLRSRWRQPLGKRRVVVQVAILLGASVLLIYLCAVLLALPSSLSPKVDFRAEGDIHVDSLVWSGLTVFPVAPLLSGLALLVQVGTLARILRGGIFFNL